MNGRSRAGMRTLRDNTDRGPSPHRVTTKPRHLCRDSTVAVAVAGEANTIRPQIGSKTR